MINMFMAVLMLFFIITLMIKFPRTMLAAIVLLVLINTIPQ